MRLQTRFRHAAPSPRRPMPTSNFDNWYIHCPKCQSLLVLLLGPQGPKWECDCHSLRSRKERGERREEINLGDTQ